ncbi:nuclear transport factor 2 family protein [Aquincola sp. S2]|uniref:Nuclear transport factor 2 family protein n=1 Tax=Pseudaquabacterium terrae TaxID=2732868 RepID=A0ABX2EKP5_9BURK|nr:nuclear transport factor 2 family protein [Aquabacterium terrae]NRF69240.1 nuclear transport factor 2 family protein [Aquabacterium terrae]
MQPLALLHRGTLCCGLAALGLAVASAFAQPAAGTAQPIGITQAGGPAQASAQPEAEIQALLQRHARAWYEGNSALMAATIHPHYQRQLLRHTANQPDAMEMSPGLALLDQTDRGHGRNTEPGQRRAEVSALQVQGGLASAVLQFADRSERLQLVRWNNQWRVLHAVAEAGAR